MTVSSDGRLTDLQVIVRSTSPLGQLIDQAIEWWMSPVPVGEQRFGDGPGDTERGIIPRHANFPPRIVQIRALVFHLRDGARHTEAMGKAGWDVALFEVVRRNRNPHPAGKGRRATPQIDGNVED